MEFSLRFMFCRTLKKRSREATKTNKKGSKRKKFHDTRRVMSRHRMENVMSVTLMSHYFLDFRIKPQC